MAFLFPEKEVDELFDIEIVEDVLLTQNMIEASIRDTMALVKEINYGERVMGFYHVSLNGIKLVEAFRKACSSVFINREKGLLHIDDDLSEAWRKFEHFQFPPISDCIIEGKLDESCSRWMREKYYCYNRSVMPYRDFFMLSDEERLSRLIGKVK